MRNSRPDARAVVVIGEALLDIIDDGGERTAVPGGSAANVALGLARRDVPVLFSTCLGPDDNGRRIADFLSGEGVRLSNDAFDAGRTSTAVARRDAHGDVTYEFDVEWRPRDLSVLDGAEVIHLGSFAAFAPDDERLPDALGAAAGFVTFDPNVRPALMPPVEEARARFRSLLPGVDLLKLSDVDAEYLMPGLAPDAVADELLSAGPRLVVVTLGEEGLLLATAKDRTRVPAVITTVADTIGAGDTVMASLIVDVARAADIDGALAELTGLGERATAAAAVTVSRHGADLPREEDL